MFKVIVNTMLIFVFLGCGGGTSPSSTNLSFVGQEIEGLKEVSNGDEVSFYVGDILLAKVTNVHENMTLFDLGGVIAPVKALDVKKSLKDNSLYRVINIASFLQTIDQDGDASNGIEIPKELEALSTDVYLDFNASPYSFSHSFELRKLMSEGREKGVWEADRHIVNPYVALDVLYISLNLKPEIFVVESEQYLYQLNDSNDTGTSFDSNGNAYERRVDSNTSYVYNELGRVEVSFEDGTNLSTPKSKKLFFYDKYFNKIREEVYLDSSIEIQFDANGNAFYTNGESNGTFTLYEVTEQRYNENIDLLTSRTRDVKEGYSIERNITLSYDKYGNKLTYENSFFQSFNINGIEKSCTDYVYNGLGAVTLERFDRDCDNKINSLSKYTYDTKQQSVEMAYDFDADGLIDSNTTTVFYDDGKRKQIFLTYSDGVIDSTAIAIYDKYDNVIYSTYEFNGSVYFEDNRTYTYSSTGKVLKEEVHNKEGLLSEISVTSYDNLDNILITETKDVLTDTVVYKATYTYDTNGYRLTSDVFIYNYIKYIETFTYDAFGNELTSKKITTQDENLMREERTRKYLNTSKWISLTSSYNKLRSFR